MRSSQLVYYRIYTPTLDFASVFPYKNTGKSELFPKFFLEPSLKFFMLMSIKFTGD